MSYGNFVIPAFFLLVSRSVSLALEQSSATSVPVYVLVQHCVL